MYLHAIQAIMITLKSPLMKRSTQSPYARISDTRAEVPLASSLSCVGGCTATAPLAVDASKASRASSTLMPEKSVKSRALSRW